MIIDDPTTRQMHVALSLRAERQALIHENIANVETPGHRPRDIDFAETMRRARLQHGQPDRTHGDHLWPRELEAQPVYQDDERADLVREMSRLSQNSGAYMRTAALFRGHLKALLTAASDGRA
ncbi:MAG: flagellar basal body rod protein FlgB [Acidobacteriota bacterium]